MGKFISATTLDQELNYIALCDYMSVVTGSSTTYSDMYSGSVLAIQAMAGGDYSLSGATYAPRVLTVAAKSGISITASGTALYVALICGSGSTVRAITTCSSQVLTSGGTCDIPSFSFTLNQPT
jgi:hypothetical protein